MSAVVIIRGLVECIGWAFSALVLLGMLDVIDVKVYIGPHDPAVKQEKKVFA